jgi:urease accessory protein UreE
MNATTSYEMIERLYQLANRHSHGLISDDEFKRDATKTAEALIEQLGAKQQSEQEPPKQHESLIEGVERVIGIHHKPGPDPKRSGPTTPRK